jgi:hypothetical protein
MSSSIWTRCAGASRIRPLRLAPWRVVESQHHVSTRKLVDSLEEQALLEQLIETAKPPSPAVDRYHVLIAAPFRYPPLKYGSRFGTRQETGIWYGAEGHRPLFAEMAYYRFVFLEGTRADLGSVTTWHTAFTVKVRTDRGVDLTLPPFDAYRKAIASPVEYGRSQALGRAMRDASVEVFRYPSARDRHGGVNVGVFAPAAFGTVSPRSLEAWHCTANRARVEMVRQDLFESAAFTFARDEFLVDDRLPAPAL